MLNHECCQIGGYDCHWHLEVSLVQALLVHIVVVGIEHVFTRLLDHQDLYLVIFETFELREDAFLVLSEVVEQLIGISLTLNDDDMLHALQGIVPSVQLLMDNRFEVLFALKVEGGLLSRVHHENRKLREIRLHRATSSWARVQGTEPSSTEPQPDLPF